VDKIADVAERTRMTWTNFELLSTGQKIYGFDTGKQIFISAGIAVEKIFPDGVVDYGDSETMHQETKYLVKENL
jgi:hypothetical protein